MVISKINDDLKNAMKSGDAFGVGVLRMVIAAFKNKSIEKRGKGQPEEITEEEALDVLRKEVKKRHDATLLYEQGSRADLAEQEKKEAVFLQTYLPAQRSRDEVEKVIDVILSKSNFTHFGEAMKAVMAELRGKTDGKIVTEILKEKLSK